MQHYRVPTRLLDWTSSPFAALFFALDGSSADSEAIVWGLDPAHWNHGMLNDVSEDKQMERVFPTTDDLVTQYYPNSDNQTRRAEPLAIHGVVNNDRINAQRGKFVVFGHNNNSMEHFFQKFSGWDRDPMIKIVLPKNSLKELRSSLFDFGFTHTAVYPDLEGLARELRFKHGF
jgi:hypothetical protein